jgi:uncharacterized protein involved in exopolysaccharide biosynthesis
MRQPPTTSPDDIDIVSLWGVLRRALPRLFALTIGAGVATFTVLSLVAPRYLSEAQLAIEAKATNPFPDKKDGAAPDAITPRMDKEAMNTHARALVAPQLLLRVADKLMLRENREFNSELGSLDVLGAILRLVGIGGPRRGESEEDRVLGEVTRRLEVSVARESRFIPIRFSSADPQLAADFANELADAYRATIVKQTIQETRDVVRALDPKIEQLRKELIEAEAEVERTRVQIDRTSSSSQQRSTLIEQRLTELTAELTKADALRSDAEVKWRTARELMATNSAELLPEVQKSPQIMSLVQQRIRAERQVAELSAALLAGHPRMQQLNADLAGLKRQIASEVGKAVQGLEKEAKVAALRVEAISRQIGEIKGRVVTTSGDDARLRALDASAKTKRSELERLQRQVEDNSTVVVTRTVPIEARIISAARPSSVPVFPKKGPFSLLAMAATLLFGIAWVVTRELLVGARAAGGGPSRRTFAAPSGLRFEPAIASATARVADSAMAAAAEPAPASAAQGKGADAVALLVGQLFDKAGEQPGYRSLIAGERKGVDVSALASAVAAAIAKAGRQVVLIDWDLDGRGICEALAIPCKPGISELIEGSASFEDVVTRIPGTEAHFIPCGQGVSSNAAALDPDNLNLVLDALDEAYDHIVVAGAYDPARELFEAIQGRFDAGIAVGAGKGSPRTEITGDDTFLGFEVADITIIRHEQAAATAIARGTGVAGGARAAAGRKAPGGAGART